jgi:hypothetical protein
MLEIEKNIAVPEIERHSWKLDEYHTTAKSMAVGDSVALRPRQEIMEKDPKAEQAKVYADANCLIARIRRIYGKGTATMRQLHKRGQPFAGYRIWRNK